MTSLSTIVSEFIAAIPSIILFVIIVLIGYGVAAVVAGAIKRFLTGVFKEPTVQQSAGVVAGAVKALVFLIALAIAFSVLSLGPATVYTEEIANYLPKLAGAIVLLTVGVMLVNYLTDYVQKQTAGGLEPSMASAIFSLLRFGLYAAIIVIAVDLAIFSVIPVPATFTYTFYSVIIGAILLYAAYSVIDVATDRLKKTEGEALGPVIGYGRWLLYFVVLVIVIGIVAAPLAGVTNIIYAISWGLAIAFAIALIPMVAYLVKRFLAEVK